MHVPPSHSSSRRRRDGPQHTALTRHTESWRPGRGRRLVRCKPPTTTHWTPPSNNPGRWRLLQTCASATAPERSCGGLRGGSVRATARWDTRRPLVHYLLSCPATPPLRPGPAPAAQPARWGAAEWA
ncbi:hypothetical protein GWK47_003050 [Chionoecetes opilio]|uniref:Uncharacterized protein n=1 Tax=Chionoecetes opilio TaxID=41210 RepID=A0A8J8WET4_CHIOP|nr:hypothetical protein GWK47_003050 [Chionoecetes opilio]